MNENAALKLPDEIVKMLEEYHITSDCEVFFRNNQWYYRKKESNNLVKGRDCPSPIESLGPFGTSAVDVKITINEQTNRYIITEINQKTVTDENLLVGMHTPLSEITLEGFARRTAQIPDNATHFCWLYPVEVSTSIESEFLEETKAESLLKFGGFAYFQRSEDVKLICVNALILTDDNGIIFESPKGWISDFTKCLWDEGRFRPVTLPALLEKKVRYFAFISPYEELQSSTSNERWRPSPNGAFVYLFGEIDSPHRYDSYFNVADECLGFTVTE